MVKPKEDKLEKDNDLMIVGVVNLSIGKKTADLINSFLMESNNDNTNDEVVQGILQDIGTSPFGKDTGKTKVTDFAVQDKPQDATSYADGGKGKEKVVEPAVQYKLQDRISTAAAKKRNTEIWFRLVASNQENTIAPLQQVSSSFIRVKNSNMQVSYIKQYLVKKLDLKSENEVELYLENEPLHSSILLPDLWQYWISTKKDVDLKNLEVGSSGAGYVMVINYGRKPGHVIKSS